ncbi:MAG: hypothetical protein R3C28_11425 [Pirellulaceae bacterium]
MKYSLVVCFLVVNLIGVSQRVLGDVFVAAGHGIWQYDTSGQLLEVLHPEKNLALVESGDDNDLFAIGHDGLWHFDLLSGDAILLNSIDGTPVVDFEYGNGLVFTYGCCNGPSQFTVLDAVTGRELQMYENSFSPKRMEFNHATGALRVSRNAWKIPDDPIFEVEVSPLGAFVLDPFSYEFEQVRVDEEEIISRYVDPNDPLRTYDIVDVPSGFANPNNVAIDESGNLYYAGVFDTLFKVSESGERFSFERPPSANGTNWLLDVAYQPFLNRYGDDTSPLSIRDVTMVTREVASGRVRDELDVDSSGNVTTEELISFLRSEQIVVGDANLDGIFNAADLVDVFQLSNFEAGEELTLDWSMGDFNGDRQFSTRDLVMAFVAGGYHGNSPTVQSVPEPGVLSLLMPAFIIVACLHHRRWPSARL